ncbi:uncharacterized protein [Hetaerina americana]|uniref:uncharacterized protein n=1 Tax=Hetaerina americana TaxID=62018 RepID=UPI003A7F1ADF
MAVSEADPFFELSSHLVSPNYRFHTMKWCLVLSVFLAGVVLSEINALPVPEENEIAEKVEADEGALDSPTQLDDGYGSKRPKKPYHHSSSHGSSSEEHKPYKPHKSSHSHSSDSSSHDSSSSSSSHDSSDSSDSHEYPHRPAGVCVKLPKFNTMKRCLILSALLAGVALYEVHALPVQNEDEAAATPGGADEGERLLNSGADIVQRDAQGLEKDKERHWFPHGSDSHSISSKSITSSTDSSSEEHFLPHWPNSHSSDDSSHGSNHHSSHHSSHDDSNHDDSSHDGSSHIDSSHDSKSSDSSDSDSSHSFKNWLLKPFRHHHRHHHHGHHSSDSDDSDDSSHSHHDDEVPETMTPE